MTIPVDHGDQAPQDVLGFTALTFLITLGTGYAVVLSNHAQLVNGAHQVQHPIRLPLAVAILLVIIGGWAPGLSAIAAAASKSGRAGVRQLFKQFGRWKVNPIWYATALFGPALLGLIALSASAFFGTRTPVRWFLRPSLRLLGLAVGPWGEELGWRGYAQRTLQAKIGAFWTSIVVGTIWSVWHYWPVLTPAGGYLTEFLSGAFLTWLAYEIANSVIIAWLYNSTVGSLPIAWAAHAGLTLGQSVVDKHPIPFGTFVLTFWTAAAVITFWAGPRTLSRGIGKTKIAFVQQESKE